MRTPFAGINPSHLFDHAGEWHAFVQGVADVIPPWPPRWRIPAPALLAEIMDDHHYYQAGRTVGFILLITAVLVLFSYIHSTTTTPGPPCQLPP